MAYAAGAAGAAVAAVAQAIKASGAIVSIEPNDFAMLLSKAESPVVVVATSGYRKKKYQYLTGNKGLVFFTKSNSPLQFTSNTEFIVAKKNMDFWIKGKA